MVHPSHFVCYIQSAVQNLSILDSQGQNWQYIEEEGGGNTGITRIGGAESGKFGQNGGLLVAFSWLFSHRPPGKLASTKGKRRRTFLASRGPQQLAWLVTTQSSSPLSLSSVKQKEASRFCLFPSMFFICYGIYNLIMNASSNGKMKKKREKNITMTVSLTLCVSVQTMNVINTHLGLTTR